MTHSRLGSMVTLFLSAVICAATAIADENPPMPGFRAAQSEPAAIEIADQVMQALGGREAWDETRYVRWRFFDRRTHYWDKWTGDVRIELVDRLILMNIHSKTGRAWQDSVEVTDAVELAKMMKSGFGMWTNDSYWVFMPYKLKDSGAALRYGGTRKMQNGREADVLDLTFADVGLTPENRYEIMVDRETHLVGEWAFYDTADATEPRFVLPWANWAAVGRIMLAGDHGRDKDWQLAVYDDLPGSVFDSPEPVVLP